MDDDNQLNPEWALSRIKELEGRISLLCNERIKAKALIYSLLGTDDEPTQAAKLLAWSRAHGAVERDAEQ